MNDEFLIHYRQTPRRAFADDLLARLTRERRPGRVTRLVSTPARRFATGLIALCLVASTVLLAAPGARAAVGQLIRTIGGITFDFTTPPPDSSGATIIPERVVSLAEARATLPFELRLPAWAPEGFVLQEDQVRIWLHASGAERQTHAASRGWIRHILRGFTCTLTSTIRQAVGVSGWSAARAAWKRS